MEEEGEEEINWTFSSEIKEGEDLPPFFLEKMFNYPLVVFPFLILAGPPFVEGVHVDASPPKLRSSLWPR
jgi:hypothetical protein